MNSAFHKKNWLLGDIKVHIETPPIPLIKCNTEKKSESALTKVKLRRNPTSFMLDIYKYKITLFENGKPVELPLLVRDFQKTTDITGETSTSGNIQCLHIFLHKEALNEFETVWVHISCTNNRNFT